MPFSLIYLGTSGRSMIYQRERHFALAVLGKAVEHALTGERLAFGLEIARHDRRPGRHIIKTACSIVGASRLQEQLYGRHLAGIPREIAAELGQQGAIGGFRRLHDGWYRTSG